MEGTPTGEASRECAECTGESRELEMRAKFEERAMMMETANRFEITLKLRTSINSFQVIF